MQVAAQVREVDRGAVAVGLPQVGELAGRLLEALRLQTSSGPVRGRNFGLGWVVGPRGEVPGISASGPGASASLLVRDPARPGGCGQVQVALANRLIPIEPLNLRVLRACDNRQ